MSQPQEGMSRRELRRLRRQQAAQRNRLITIVGVILLASVAAYVLITQAYGPVGDIAVPEPLVRPQAQANAAGDPGAPITIEEFGDYQCPHCRTFYAEIEPELVNSYVADGTVRFIYRSFGEFIGPESRAAAEAAYCAGDQDKFWEMHDIIFANHKGENVGAYDNKHLIAFAEKLELDMDTFRSCFQGGQYSDQVDQDLADGRAAGVQATPSFVMSYVVNGETKTQLIEGAVPFGEFQAAIEAALAEMNAQ